MATEEEPSIVYDTLEPLLDCDFVDALPSADIVLDEDADASPTQNENKKKKKKKKTKKADPAIETANPIEDDELTFLNKKSELNSQRLNDMVSTVFRSEIVATDSDNSPEEMYEGEVNYFSLDVNGSKLQEEAGAGLVNPVLVSEEARELVNPAVIPEDVVKVAEDPPWSRVQNTIRSPLLLLHQEIANFCQFVSPTPEEQAARLAAVERVSEVIKFIWPHCQVKVFGSFETGLYLPSSDIDVVILHSDVRIPQNGLQALAKALSQKSVAHKIQVIGKARVPIVKFIEKESDVAFDISFDVENGPDAANFIKDAIAQIPPLKPLCLVLKIFLQQRELNEVYSGGIGSYALLVMLMTHLQMHWSRQGPMGRSNFLERNLGILLIDFFDLYGRKLNAWDVGVSCRSGGQFFPKNLRGFLNSKRPYLLSVEDPQAPENDIGKNSYNIPKVRAAFNMAHRLLTDIENDDLVSSQYTILGRIVRVDKKLLERKAGCMEVPRLDNFLSIASHRAVKYDSDSDGIMLHPLIEKQGKFLKRWQLCDDEPLPRGGEFSREVHGQPSGKRGLKRKWKEEKLHETKHTRKEKKVVEKKQMRNDSKACKQQQQKHLSKKDKRQLDISPAHHSKGHRSKKGEQITHGSLPEKSSKGLHDQKSKNSGKQMDDIYVVSKRKGNSPTTTVINSVAHKKIKYF
eukprot:Gb_02324 [translate_table: standard]